MKAKSIFLLILIHIGSISFAQKETSETVKYRFYQLGNFPTPSDYDLQLSINPSGWGLTESEISEKFRTRVKSVLGKKKPDVSSTFKIVIKLDEITSATKIMDPVYDTVIVDEVKQVIKKYKADYTCKYDFALSFMIGDSVLWDTSNHKFINRGGITDPYESQEEAAKDAEESVKRMADVVLRNLIKLLNEKTTSEITGYARYVEFQISSFESKKFDYSTFNEKSQKLIKLIDQSSSLEVRQPAMLQNDIATLIKEFDSILDDYDPNIKKSKYTKKFLNALYKHLTISNFIIKDFAESQKYMELAEKDLGLMKTSSWSPWLKKLISEQQPLLQSHGYL